MTYTLNPILSESIAVHEPRGSEESPITIQKPKYNESTIRDTRFNFRVKFFSYFRLHLAKLTIPYVDPCLYITGNSNFKSKTGRFSQNHEPENIKRLEIIDRRDSPKKNVKLKQSPEKNPEQETLELTRRYDQKSLSLSNHRLCLSPPA